MPNHDFHCRACGAILQDIYRSIVIGGRANPPPCPRCGALMEWVIPLVAVDAKEPFKRFSVHRQVPTRDGLVQVEESIDSLHKMRQIEKDSEQRYINGEGEPLRFRGYNQDSSNRDQNSFGADGSIGGRAYSSGATPQKKSNISTTRHGATKPRVSVARGGGVSPLKKR